jgi:hypothetical protein
MDGSVVLAEDLGPSEQEVTAKLLEVRKKLQDALSQCDPDDDQFPTAAISRAIDRCSSTISELQAKTAQFDSLRKFRLRVSIPTASTRHPAQVVIRLDQMRTSKPLELNDYIVIKPPIGPELTTPRVATRFCFFNYTHAFDIPDRSPRNIALTKASDVEFTIWRYTAEFHKKIGQGRVDLLAHAKAPLLPLCFSAMVTTPLEFKTPDGEKTYYAFETTMTTAEPLIPERKEILDEQVELVKEG